MLPEELSAGRELLEGALEDEEEKEGDEEEEDLEDEEELLEELSPKQPLKPRERTRAVAVISTIGLYRFIFDIPFCRCASAEFGRLPACAVGGKDREKQIL